MDLRRSLGSRGERAAAAFLRNRGFKLVATNYVTPFGEIDLVAVDGDTLVFVEVRSRGSQAAPAPEASVDRAKQQRLVRVARCFQDQTACHRLPCRFDVVSVIEPPEGEPHVEHFADAFHPGSRFAG